MHPNYSSWSWRRPSLRVRYSMPTVHRFVAWYLPAAHGGSEHRHQSSTWNSTAVFEPQLEVPSMTARCRCRSELAKSSMLRCSTGRAWKHAVLGFCLGLNGRSKIRSENAGPSLDSRATRSPRDIVDRPELRSCSLSSQRTFPSPSVQRLFSIYVG